MNAKEEAFVTRRALDAAILRANKAEESLRAAFRDGVKAGRQDCAMMLRTWGECYCGSAETLHEIAEEIEASTTEVPAQ